MKKSIKTSDLKITDFKLVEILRKGGIGVLPSDTLYGLMGSALNKRAVERIYKVRRRNPLKPMIILIGSFSDLKLFGIKIEKGIEDYLKKVWPGKVSVVLPCPDKKFFYLSRGTGTLAFRFPQRKDLENLLKKTGPLVAPSANPEGFHSAKTIQRAKKYFGDNVDFYVNEGRILSPSSTIITFRENGKIKILRRGAYKFNKSIKK